MNVEAFAGKADLAVLCMPSPERTVSGVYIGDLLSWVMGRASADNAWITIMSNINTVAVASLADVSCIILAEGVEPDAQITDAAISKGINILSSTLTAYELAKKMAELAI